MANLKQRPYHLLLLTAFAILIVSLFTSDETVDIYLHDTYFIIALAHFLQAMSVLLLILWTLYLFAQRFLLSKFLMWMHIIFTIASLLFLVAILFYSNHYYQGLAGKPRRYYDYGSWNQIMLSKNLTKGVLATFLMVMLGFFAFIINFFIGLYNNLRGGCTSR